MTGRSMNLRKPDRFALRLEVRSRYPKDLLQEAQ